MQTCALRSGTWILLTTLLFCAAPASAQYKPRPLTRPATGEQWHVEGGADLWMPSATMVVASESLGIQGSQIDVKRDLGVTDQTLRSLQLQLRPSPKHKFRLQFTPIKYEASATLQQDVVFNGIRYRLGLPVNTVFDWKAYRFGYEFDFVTRN